MKRYVLMSIFLISGLMVFAQNKDSKKVAVNKPDVHYKVNKTYDSHGNLIGYDSTYSYSVGGQQAMTDADSVFKQMNPMHGMPAAFSNISDSAMMAEMFNQPGFDAGWQGAMKQMKAEMQQMDSMQQAFMQQVKKQDKKQAKNHLKPLK